jgi:DNA-binding transcriptional LysR family regulator
MLALVPHIQEQKWEQAGMIQSRKIRYFLAAAKHLHFSAAAAELCISQPALSRSMRQLEERLGAPLFERAAKGVVLTRYGELLARRARVMELDAQHTLAEIEAIKMGTGGTLNIGAGPIWMKVYLPKVVAAMQRINPNLQINLVSGVMESHLSALMNGKIDVLCGDLDFPQHPELTCTHLLDLEFVVIAGKNHPLADKVPIKAEQLLRYPWITMRGDYLGRNRFGGYFAANNLQPPKSSILVSPGVDSFDFLLAENYLAYIPLQSMPYAELNSCVRIGLDAAFWRAPHGVVHRATKSPEVAITSFLATVKSQLSAETTSLKPELAAVR